MIASTTQLNTPGMRLAALPGVHALTDVTGFGLLGHLLEVCRGSGVRQRVWTRGPAARDALELAAAGHVTAAPTNWQGYGNLVDLTRHGDVEQAILTDPQTSGGCWSPARPKRQKRFCRYFRAEAFRARTSSAKWEPGRRASRSVAATSCVPPYPPCHDP